MGMAAAACWLGDKKFDKTPQAQEVNPFVKQMLTENIGINSNGFLKKQEQGTGVRLVQVGNKTECALLQLSNDWDCEYQAIRDNLKPSVIKSFPFSSDLKRMSTVIKLPDGSIRVFVKGASEIVLQYCSSLLDSSGHPALLSCEKKTQVTKDIIEHFAEQTL